MTIKMNAIHLATMMALVFLYFPARAKSRQDAPSAIDWMCVGLALLGGLYIIVSYDRILADRLEVNQMDLIISVYDHGPSSGGLPSSCRDASDRPLRVFPGLHQVRSLFPGALFPQGIRLGKGNNQDGPDGPGDIRGYHNGLVVLRFHVHPFRGFPGGY